MRVWSRSSHDQEVELVKNVCCRLLLCTWAIFVLPGVSWAGIIQGPVKGSITLADGREA